MSRPHLSSFVPSMLALVAGTALAQPAAPAAPAHGAPNSRYSVRQHWDLGAPGRWDYLAIDPVRRRLYVTRGDRVQVLDPGSGRLLGEIPATAGVHGVAFAQDLKLGFTSNGTANTVTVFDLDTLKVKKEVPAGGVKPDAILYAPGTHKLYTFNGKSGDVSVFDAADMHQVALIPVGGKPEFAADDGAGHIFVNIEDKAEIVEIDAQADRVLAHWPLAGCEEPSGLALDAAHRRLFSVCANHVMAVTDSLGGKAVAQVRIGGKPDAAAYDPGTGTVFASNGAGTLSVIHQHDADHYDVVATVPTQPGARTMALDPGSGRVYLPVADDHRFSVLVAEP